MEPETAQAARSRLVTIVGGPADRRSVEVPLVAGRLPLYLGIEGASYTLDGGALDVAYVHWPAGAEGPVRRPE